MSGDDDKRAKFALGRVVMTAAVARSVPAAHVRTCLDRHIVGDWGAVCEEDQGVNDLALEHGDRLMSVYSLRADEAPGPETDAGKLWIITEADRSVTTVLFPDDY